MNPYPSTPAEGVAGLPRAPGAGTAGLRLLGTLEALILSVLAALLGRRPRRSQSWLATPAHLPSPTLDLPTRPIPLRARTPHDGTHLVCESPILYVIGPGPNRGLRPLPRATPVARARVARAPPTRR